MSRKPPSTAEQRLQILEILSARLDDLKGETGKLNDKMASVQQTLSEMRGAGIVEQLKELKGDVDKQNDRVRLLEDFKNNLLGKMAAGGILLAFLTAILTTLAVRLIGGH